MSAEEWRIVVQWDGDGGFRYELQLMSRNVVTGLWQRITGDVLVTTSESGPAELLARMAAALTRPMIRYRAAGYEETTEPPRIKWDSRPVNESAMWRR